MEDTDELLEEWFRAELERDPVHGTGLGLDGYDDRFGDLSAAAFERQPLDDRRWAGRLGRLDVEGMSLDQRIDVTLVLSDLAGRAAMADWQAWRRDPSLYIGPMLNGVFSLFLHRIRPEAELAAAAVARLRQVPAVVAAARANLDPELAPRLLVERGLRSCQGGITYFRELLAGEVGDDRLRPEVAQAGADAAVALEDLAAHLGALAERARGDWALGEARYSALLHDRELLGYGAAEMHAAGLVAWSDLDREMAALAGRIKPEGGGWRAVVAGLARDHPASPEAMRDAYERVCVAARQFLRDRKLVTLPEGEQCLVIPSPVFQRPVLAVASYMLPPPFSGSRTGHFFVPFPPAGTTPEQLVQRLSDNSFHSIPTVAVHEAYPGHHWQLTWANRTTRPVRHLVTSSYFVEGWALYAETMMREQGFFADPRQELSHLDARIFRAARVVVDTALHTGEMTVEEAVTHMSTRASLTEAVARAEVDRYCAWPTQAPSYLTGSLEIERIRRRWDDECRGDLRTFHDTIAASPGLPIALAELAVFDPGAAVPDAG